MLESFLARHPLRAAWLDEIVGVFLRRPQGEASLSEVVAALKDHAGERTAELMAARCMNDFSSAAEDPGRPHWDLFQRRGPRAFRLRSWPVRPDTLVFNEIGFCERPVQRTYALFAQMILDQQPQVWAQTDARARLEAFAKGLAPEGPLRKDYLLFLEEEAKAPAPAPAAVQDVALLGWTPPAGR